MIKYVNTAKITKRVMRHQVGKEENMLFSSWTEVVAWKVRLSGWSFLAVLFYFQNRRCWCLRRGWFARMRESMLLLTWRRWRIDSKESVQQLRRILWCWCILIPGKRLQVKGPEEVVFMPKTKVLIGYDWPYMERKWKPSALMEWSQNNR